MPRLPSVHLPLAPAVSRQLLYCQSWLEPGEAGHGPWPPLIHYAPQLPLRSLKGLDCGQQRQQHWKKRQSHSAREVGQKWQKTRLSNKQSISLFIGQLIVVIFLATVQQRNQAYTGQWAAVHNIGLILLGLWHKGHLKSMLYSAQVVAPHRA